mgnify:CR=1 FL=1
MGLLNRSRKQAFKAQIDVYGHRFILYAYSQEHIGIWFDSIMEVLNIGLQK